MLEIPCLVNSGLKWTQQSTSRNRITTIYEPIQLEIFAAIVRKFQPHVVVDVGANIGVYGLIAAVECANVSIHLFEASPATAKECQSNVELNQLEGRATVHRLAVSDKTGRLSFFDEGRLSGRNSVFQTSIHCVPENQTFEIDCCPLDQIVSDKDCKCVIKIDTEGHEMEVLRGAEQLLTSNRCYVQCEAGYRDLDEPIEYMKQLGYERMLSVGPDLFFSNEPREAALQLAIAPLETQLRGLLEDHVRTSGSLATQLAKLSLLQCIAVAGRVLKKKTARKRL